MAKVDPILKLSYYKATTQIAHVFRTKVVHAVFTRTCCSMTPCQALDELTFFFVFVVFGRKFWISDECRNEMMVDRVVRYSGSTNKWNLSCYDPRVLVVLFGFR